jgi:hypothetical protein
MTKLEKIEGISRDLAGIVEMALGELGDAVGYGDKLGYALLTFDLGAGGNMVWMSNAQRGDMIDALREQLDSFETGEADGLRSEDRAYEFEPGVPPRRCSVGSCMTKSHFQVQVGRLYYFPCGDHLAGAMPNDPSLATITRLQHD